MKLRFVGGPSHNHFYNVRGNEFVVMMGVYTQRTFLVRKDPDTFTLFKFMAPKEMSDVEALSILFEPPDGNVDAPR